MAKGLVFFWKGWYNIHTYASHQISEKIASECEAEKDL